MSGGGVEWEDVENSSIRGNEFRNSSAGIFVTYGRNNSIQANILAYSSDSSIYHGIGIILSNSQNMTLVGNTIQNTAYGLFIQNCTGLNIFNNSFFHSYARLLRSFFPSGDSITLSESVSIVLEGNQFHGSGILLEGDDLQFWNSHTITSSNTINGQEITVIKNRSDEKITSLEGPVIIIDCHDLQIIGMHCINSSIGVLIGFSSGITISNSTFVSNSVAAVSIKQSPSQGTNPHRIESNLFRSNDDVLTIDFTSSAVIRQNIFRLNEGTCVRLDGPNSTIANNTIIDNDNGLEIYGNHTTMEGNIILNNMGSAISVRDANDLTIRNNLCSNNTGTGISIGSSSDAVIHSNICDNNGRGISVTRGYNYSITLNACSNNSNDGISLDHTYDSTIAKNICSGNNLSGLRLDSCNENTILNNTFSWNLEGIDLNGWTYRNTFLGNSIIWNRYGISLGELTILNTYQDNAIVNNQLFGIVGGEQPREEIIISQNWWGHSSGPYHPEENPGGRGDNISGPGEFSPWLKRWSDPTLVRTRHPSGSERNDDGDDTIDLSGFFMMVLTIILIGLFAALVIVVRSTDNGSTIGMKGTLVPHTGRRQHSSRKPNQNRNPRLQPHHHSLWKRSQQPVKPCVPSIQGPTETICSHCQKVINLDPQSPSIRITCQHCGEEIVAEQFRTTNDIHAGDGKAI